MKNFILLCLFFFLIAPSFAQKKVKLPEIGVVNDIENNSLLKAQGYSFLVESTQKIFSPLNVSQRQFDSLLPILKNLDITLLASNIFIPGSLKVVGPNVDEQAVLKYVEGVFQRAKAAGVNLIIWGSGGSRQIPEGFNRNTAKEQFISMAKKVATVAKKYDIVLALENLNSTEGNFINTVEEAFEIVKSVDHKNFRLCADIYHMLKEGESSDIIKKTKSVLIYCEIAEKEGRTPPGVQGEDFRPYLRALNSIGYTGKIVIECRWEDLAEQGDDAYQYLQDQLKEVYNN